MTNLIAIGILLIVVTIVFLRLPKIELGHSAAFRKRRVLNWLPLGLTYAFLYMGRYNLKVSKFAFEEMTGAGGAPLMGNDAFSIIFGVGVFVYGFSFLINGPLTDRYGGRFSILLGAGGSLVMNLLMGLASWALLVKGVGYGFLTGEMFELSFGEQTFSITGFVLLFSLLYGANMYFQSFGAVAIVKVNAAWFHVRERGVFGAIFGILISLGVYFAFDWSYAILGFFKPEDAAAPNYGLMWVFFVPTGALAIFWVLDVFFVRNSPGEAGQKDFDTADASSGDDGESLSAVQVFKLMFKNPIIMTIAGIEFCSGFLRQAIMQWFRTFAKQTNDTLHLKDFKWPEYETFELSVIFDYVGAIFQSGFVYQNWGLLLCCAGIMGGVFAGTISDHIFQSRRGPVAAVLYGIMLVGAFVLTFAYQTAAVGWLVLFMSMAVIGVHGMLSGTASMDFGGKKNVGIAVGIIDGFVYLGTFVMSLTYAFILPKEKFVDGKLVGDAADPNNWSAWPISMIPLAFIGLVLATRVWNAKPKGKAEKAAKEVTE